MRGPGAHDPVDPVTGERVAVHPTVDPRTLEDVRRDAYERGVADERARHKRNPLLSILIALVALLGIAVIALAIWRGSFSEAGRTLDQTTQDAAAGARTLGAEAADETGEAMQDAGAAVERRGESEQGQSSQPTAQPAAQPAPAPAPVQ